MKKIFYCLTAALAMAFASCSDWTEPEAKQMTRYNNTEIAKTETYYKALRDWKKTKHSITFGWYGGWSDPAASTANMLSGIPDSMDVVSLWDGATNLSEGKRKDLKFVQKVKGTKIVMCSFTKWVGDGVTPAEYNESTEKRHEFWAGKTATRSLRRLPYASMHRHSSTQLPSTTTTALTSTTSLTMAMVASWQAAKI